MLMFEHLRHQSVTLQTGTTELQLRKDSFVVVIVGNGTQGAIL